MTRTEICNTQKECIGVFGDTLSELGYLVEFMKGKKEVSRSSERKGNVNYITIVVKE